MIDATYFDGPPDKTRHGALAAALALHVGVLGLVLVFRGAAPAGGADVAAMEMEMVWAPAPERAVSPAVPVALPAPAKAAAVPGRVARRPRPVAVAPIPPAAPGAIAASARPPMIAPKPADPPAGMANAADALWESQLLERLARLKRYPFAARRDGQQDVVLVRFVIDRGGQVLASDIVKSQGFALLDREARALIRRASPLPAPPADVLGAQIAMVAPIQFVLAAAP